MIYPLVLISVSESLASPGNFVVKPVNPLIIQIDNRYNLNIKQNLIISAHEFPTKFQKYYSFELSPIL